MARRLLRTEIWTDVTCSGGVALGALQPRSVVTQKVLQGTGTQVEVVLSRTDAKAAQVAAGRILRLVFEDGSFEEYRVRQRVRVHDEANLVTVVGLPLEDTDLAEGTRIFEVDSFTGLARNGGGFVQLDAGTAIAAYVLPALAAAGLSFYAVGTITPTTQIDLNWDDRPTPREFIERVMEALRAKGVQCEWRLRRNGTTNYLIDIVTEIGSDVPTVELRLGKKLRLPVRIDEDATEQATRVLVEGKDEGSIAFARWKVINAGPNWVELADPAGAGGPLLFDDQYTGWYLYREKTGGTFLISTSTASTQMIVFQDPTYNPIQVDEFVQLRLTEPRAGTVRVRNANGSEYSRVTGVAAAQITIADSFNGGGDPIAVTDELQDRSCEWFSEVAAARGITFTVNVGTTGGRRCTVSSSAGMAVGDVLFAGATNALPTTPLFGGIGLDSWLVITGVDVAAPNEVEVVVRSTGQAPAISGMSGYAWAYRESGPRDDPDWPNFRTVRAADPATNTLTLSSAGPPLNAMVEFVNRTGRGPRPHTLNYPARDARPADGGYGPKLATIQRPLITGVANLVPNAFCRLWSGFPDEPPDGWEVGLDTDVAKTTDPLYTQYGGNSMLLKHPAAADRLLFRSPLISWVPAAVGQRLSAKLRLLVYTGDPNAAPLRHGGQIVSFGGDDYLMLQLTAVNAAGAVVSGPVPVGPGTLLYAEGSESGGAYPHIALNQWVDVIVNGIDAGALRGDTVGFYVDLYHYPAGASAIFAYVDALMVTETLEAPAEYEEFGGASSLHMAGNRVLEILSAPPFSLTVTTRQLQQIVPGLTDTDLQLGATVRVIDAALQLDTTSRIQSVTYQDHPRTADSPRLHIATRPPLFTDLAALT